MRVKKGTYAVLFLAALCCWERAIAQSVFISEIVADNDGSLIDSDGDNPDWIELYNVGGSPVDLAGWYLTDTTNDLVKWQFPATTMASNEFLLVFASGKDRAVSGAELHTSFKLSADGEELLLIRPDGTTVEDRITFPALQEDHSYGYRFSGGSEPEVLVASGAPCTARIPTNEWDAVGWTETSYDDSGWQSGNTGVGYETGSGFESLIGLDVEAMRGVNESVYIRIPFEVEDADGAATLTLSMKYDDGFVAYINGTRVMQSAQVPSSLSWQSGATTYHDDAAAVLFDAFSLDSYASLLHSGTNLLAIHGLNYALTSSDLLFVPKLEASFNQGEIDTAAAGLLETPTPGYANASIAYAGYVETPVTSPGRGFYEAALQVTVSNRTAGATIRYTTDGSTPTESSPEYTGPVTVSETTCFRVGAFVDGWKPSYPRTDTYIFVDDVASQPKTTDTINGQSLEYGMDQDVVSTTYYDASNQVVTVQDALKAIPSISLTTDYDNLYNADTGIYVNPLERWEVPASAELINPDGSEGFHVNAGLRIRGGASRRPQRPKHSFRLFFRDDYGDGKLEFPMFEDEGVDEFRKLDLRTAQNYNWAYSKDSRNTFLRDVFSRDTAAAMGDAYTRSRYYHLYLNGEYWGLFMTEERPVADFAESYFGGDADDYDAVKVISWTDPGAYSIEVTDGTLDAYNRLYAAAMAGFADHADYFALMGLDANGEPNAGKECLLDVDNLIDYLLIIYHMGASDNGITKFINNNGKVNNIYALYNRVNPDGFKWMQHDTEHGLDTTTSADRTGPFDNSNFTLAEYFNAQTLHEKLSVNEEYKIKFADRVYKHYYNGGALVQTNCEARIDSRAAQIDRAIVANAARWGSTNRDRETWVSAVATTRAWLNGRRATVIGYLDADGLIPSIDPPQISLAGGEVADGTLVALSASAGTVYFTTDGTDPRAIGGGIAGEAFTDDIIITRPTHLKARAYNGSEWSALAEATYWTPEIPLAVTELMYHAPDGNPHDFIEVKNVSAETVTLKGYKLDNAIDFKFKNAAQNELAPGEYLVVVDDVDAFNATYFTNGVNIAGEFSGDFSNSGEEVDLEFRDNDLISFSYSDARNWPQAADGAGHSLVALAIDDEESGSLDYGGNWRASTYAGGSPGYADPAAFTRVVINEITAHTDTGDPAPYDSNDEIELFNPTDSAVTLDDFYLSDDLEDLSQWAIPDGTVIEAHGFVVFDEDDFHPDRVSGFGLDKAGEQVVLSASGHVVDAVRFKGQENGVSLGRYPDGAENWITTQPTPAEPNEPAELPVWISEVMYNPLLSGNDLEYVLLENSSSSSVTLENDTGTCRIDGGVSFDFPAGTSIPAGDRLWILSFNPTNTFKLALFCAAYDLTAAHETFVGGYSGSLSDRGERIALERPQDSDDPLNPLDISWVVVDELYYFDQSPWPENADGTGYPLIRIGRSDWIAPTEEDTDGDLMQDNWEMAHFQSLEQAEADWDFDGQSNLEEYIADSNPTNAASQFVVEGYDVGTLSWTAITGRTYSVYWTDSLTNRFVRIASGLTTGSYTDHARAGTPGPHYYCIEVELE